MVLRISTVGLVSVLAMVGATACATKGYVGTRVDEVDTEIARVAGRVSSVERSVEETQAQTRKNAQRIDEVDQTANSALRSAEAANTTAEAANTTAKSAGQAASRANDRVAAFETAARRLLFEVVISEDHGQFAFNKTDLPGPAKAKIDELVERLKTYDQGVWLEIEGHTDATGPKQINERIGLERAEAVKRYLHEQHELPLHKMNVISYGEDKPAAPNDTRDGRAQNRRVVIRVLA
jgi:outer membrane protein OmpA-like peptidoglycan-associated protein